MRIRESVGNQSFFPEHDRRRAIRFPIKSRLRWVVLNRKTGPLSGTGETVNVSSAGFAFQSNLPLSPGCRLELDVEWPAELDGHVPMKLVVTGKVVRVDGLIVCVEIDRREFRTAGRRAAKAAG